MVEQGTHNPLVLGSNPGGPTIDDQGHRVLSMALFMPLAAVGMSECVWVEIVL